MVGEVKSNISAEKASRGYKLNYNNDNTIITDRYNGRQAKMHKLKEAVRKSNDGSALIKTFEGALGETVNIIRRMRSLAAEAGNPEYTDSDRVVIETEFRDLCSSIDDLANTRYDGYTLLRGGYLADQAKIENIINTEITPEIQNALTLLE